MSTVLLDAAGRRRSPATMPGYHAGRPPRNKGRRYPADPPTVEEIVAVMRQAGATPHGFRMSGLIVVLWRAGLRIHEALALTESDLDSRRGSVLVRRGKGGRRRQVGMDDWALGATAAVAGHSRRAASRPAVLRAHRTDARARLVTGRGPRATAPHSGACWRPAALRSPPAPPRPRRRDGPRGRPADRHPTPARPHQPRHHLDLPAGHRQRRDHRHRPRPPPTSRASQQHLEDVTAASGRRPSQQWGWRAGLSLVSQRDSEARVEQPRAPRGSVPTASPRTGLHGTSEGETVGGCRLNESAIRSGPGRGRAPNRESDP